MDGPLSAMPLASHDDTELVDRKESLRNSWIGVVLAAIALGGSIYAVYQGVTDDNTALWGSFTAVGVISAIVGVCLLIRIHGLSKQIAQLEEAENNFILASGTLTPDVQQSSERRDSMDPYLGDDSEDERRTFEQLDAQVDSQRAAWAAEEAARLKQETQEPVVVDITEQWFRKVQKHVSDSEIQTILELGPQLQWGILSRFEDMVNAHYANAIVRAIISDENKRESMIAFLSADKSDKAKIGFLFEHFVNLKNYYTVSVPLTPELFQVFDSDLQEKIVVELSKETFFHAKLEGLLRALPENDQIRLVTSVIDQVIYIELESLKTLIWSIIGNNNELIQKVINSLQKQLNSIFSMKNKHYESERYSRIANTLGVFAKGLLERDFNRYLPILCELRDIIDFVPFNQTEMIDNLWNTHSPHSELLLAYIASAAVRSLSKKNKELYDARNQLTPEQLQAILSIQQTDPFLKFYCVERENDKQFETWKKNLDQGHFKERFATSPYFGASEKQRVDIGFWHEVWVKKIALPAASEEKDPT